MRELLSHDGCLTPFLGDFLLIPMLTKKNLELQSSSLWHHPFFVTAWKKDRAKILLYHWSIIILDNSIHRPIFIVRLLQSRCCLSENWSARENTHSGLGAAGPDRNLHKVRPQLSSLGVGCCLQRPLSCDPLVSVGGAGLGREIFIIISQLLTIYDKSQCWYAVCWKAQRPNLCNQSPNWPPILSESIKTQVVSSCERPA